MLFTQLFESDFNNKKSLAETHDDYEDCSYCSGTGEGRYEGQSCSHCGGSGVEPAEQDDDDFDMPDDDYVDSGDEESYYEKSLRSRGLGEGQGDFEKALATLSGSWSGWHSDENQSDPDVKTYWYDDGEGGYYASGNIEHNLRTGEITVDFEDKDGYHGGDVQGTFANMGDAMRALRGGPGSHGGRAPNFDRLAQRTPYGPDDLRKTDRTGRKGTVGGGFANARKASIQHSLGRHGPKGVLPESGVAEAKKKDNSEPEVKDVALQRAISRAKADFPTAGSGIEALSKDFMRSQEQDQKSFDQIRRAERQQNQMLSKINQIDQEQEQEIQDLEQQNSGLAQRLQQLQSVNSNLEKKLAAMSGRSQKRKDTKVDTISTSSTAAAPAVNAVSAPDKAADTIEPTASPVIGKMAQDLTAEPSKSKAIGQMTRSLAPSSAIGQMAQQLQPRQKELPLDEPVTLKPKKFDTSKASDADYRELTRKLAKDIATNPARQVFNPDAVKSVAAQQEMPVENKTQDQKIAGRYAPDDFDAMVARVGQKAREQEKRKPVDIKDLARRLAAVKLPDKK